MQKRTGYSILAIDFASGKRCLPDGYVSDSASGACSAGGVCILLSAEYGTDQSFPRAIAFCADFSVHGDAGETSWKGSVRSHGGHLAVWRDYAYPEYPESD